MATRTKVKTEVWKQGGEARGYAEDIIIQIEHIICTSRMERILFNRVSVKLFSFSEHLTQFSISAAVKPMNSCMNHLLACICAQTRSI